MQCPLEWLDKIGRAVTLSCTNFLTSGSDEYLILTFCWLHNARLTSCVQSTLAIVTLSCPTNFRPSSSYVGAIRLQCPHLKYTIFIIISALVDSGYFSSPLNILLLVMLHFLWDWLLAWKENTAGRATTKVTCHQIKESKCPLTISKY